MKWIMVFRFQLLNASIVMKIILTFVAIFEGGIVK